MDQPLIQIGVVCRSHGLGGELRVRLSDPGSSALDEIAHVWTGEPGAGGKPLKKWKIERVRQQDGGFYLIVLEGLRSRNAADALHSALLYAPREELEPLAEDEFYVSDVVGFSVFTVAQEPVGTVRSVLLNPGSDLLIIARPARPGQPAQPPPEDAMVPLVPEIVVEIDFEQRKVVIDPPEGLLDINVSASRDDESDGESDDESGAEPDDESGDGPGVGAAP